MGAGRTAEGKRELLEEPGVLSHLGEIALTPFPSPASGRWAITDVRWIPAARKQSCDFNDLNGWSREYTQTDRPLFRLRERGTGGEGNANASAASTLIHRGSQSLVTLPRTS